MPTKCIDTTLTYRKCLSNEQKGSPSKRLRETHLLSSCSNPKTNKCKKERKTENNYLENEPLTALDAAVTLVDVGEDRLGVRSRVLYRRAEHSLTASPQGQNYYNYYYHVLYIYCESFSHSFTLSRTHTFTLQHWKIQV